MLSSKAVAVGLVTSGSRGNRLVFYHRGCLQREAVDSSIGTGSKLALKDVSSVLPPTTLAEILAPSSLMVNRKFELSVDEWKFVGHPFFVQKGTFSITFNVVFVLEVGNMYTSFLTINLTSVCQAYIKSYCTEQVVLAYDHLSHLIGSAIVHEELKCGFLCQEVKTLMQLLEEADIPDPSADNLLQKSSLARSLCSVLNCLQRGERHVQVKINNWSEINTLLKFEMAVPTIMESRNEQYSQPFIVRSYSALLLFESADDIIQSLPPSSNPAMQRLLTVVTPLKNLQTVSLDADIPLVLVLHLASHLVHWGKAMAIYPLSENNIYITSPTADIRLNSQLSVQFCDKFPEQSLPDVLANFSLPVSLGEIKQIIEDERVVVWLLQHKQIVQLHTYVYIVPQEDSQEERGGNDNLDYEKDAQKSDNDSERNATVSQLLHHLTPHERRSVLQTSAAGDLEDLEQFARLSQYFHGNHHLEGIMLMENIPRSQLLTLIDKFSEILVTCMLPEHSILSTS